MRWFNAALDGGVFITVAFAELLTRKNRLHAAVCKVGICWTYNKGGAVTNFIGVIQTNFEAVFGRKDGA